jgi:hypothetical protein
VSNDGSISARQPLEAGSLELVHSGQQSLVEEASRTFVPSRMAVVEVVLSDCFGAVLQQMSALEIVDTGPDQPASVELAVMAVSHTQAGVVLDEECSSQTPDSLLVVLAADGP